MIQEGVGFIKIKGAKIADLEAILVLSRQAGLENWKYSDLVLEIERENSLLIVAKFDDFIVGFCLARLIITKNIDDSISPLPLESVLESECEIYNIAVNQNYRKRGIGRLLLERLIELAAGNNTESIWLEVRKSNERRRIFT